VKILLYAIKTKQFPMNSIMIPWAAWKEKLQLKLTRQMYDIEDDSKALAFEENDMVESINVLCVKQ
jgi:hypothetical protein